MQVVPGDSSANLSKATHLTAEAARNGADIILLPEVLDVGWTDPSAQSKATPIPDGETCRCLSESARKHSVYICAGMAERSDTLVYNAAVLINPEGEVILHHRKINELDIAHPYYAQGDRLFVCHTALGTIGIMICADGFARNLVISRSLGYMGADIILSPCSWAVSADHNNTATPYGKLWIDSYMPVAREFKLWITAVSNVGWITSGPWQGSKCIGCSLVMDPDGTTVAKGPYGVDAETILYVPVEPVPRPARGCEWNDLWKKVKSNTE